MAQIFSCESVNSSRLTEKEHEEIFSPDKLLDRTIGPYRVWQWDRKSVYYTVCWALGDARLYVESELRELRKTAVWTEEVQYREWSDSDGVHEEYSAGNGVWWKIERETFSLKPDGWKREVT